jgi:hypothetical protein
MTTYRKGWPSCYITLFYGMFVFIELQKGEPKIAMHQRPKESLAQFERRVAERKKEEHD